MQRPRRRGSAICSSSSSRAPKRPSRGASSRQRNAATGHGSRRGTHGSAHRARPPSCAPKPSRWADRWRSSRPSSTSSTRRSRELADALSPITLPAAFALAARGFGVAAQAALTAYVWAWLENQVLAAVKLVPLGQVAGQRLLACAGGRNSRGRRDCDGSRGRRAVDVRAGIRARERAARNAVHTAVSVVTGPGEERLRDVCATLRTFAPKLVM